GDDRPSIRGKDQTPHRHQRPDRVPPPARRRSEDPQARHHQGQEGSGMGAARAARRGIDPDDRVLSQGAVTIPPPHTLVPKTNTTLPQLVEKQSAVNGSRLAEEARVRWISPVPISPTSAAAGTTSSAP